MLPGHASVIRSAWAYLEEHGMQVQAAVIGFTMPHQTRKKVGETVWTGVGPRAEVARSVIKDEKRQ
eukprot:5732854-Amphidinium_carterae.1